MTTNEQQFVDVILPLPLFQFFTYAIPQNLVSEIGFGKRVVVQFGAKKIYTALVYEIHKRKPQDYETKNIITVLDKVPVVNLFQLQ